MDRPDKSSSEWSYSNVWPVVGTCLYQSKSECCYCCISIIIDICWYMLVYMDIHLCVEKCTMDCFICLLICFSQEHQCIHLNVWICIYLYGYTKLYVSWWFIFSLYRYLCLSSLIVHFVFNNFTIWLHLCIHVIVCTFKYLHV